MTQKALRGVLSGFILKGIISRFTRKSRTGRILSEKRGVYTIMKEMIYRYDENLISQKREILAEGTYGDYRYIVMSHSLYPAVYIDLPHRDGYLCSNIDAIVKLNRLVRVHGGWNCACEFLDTGERDFRYGFYVGWTYNTADDYIAGKPFSNHKDGKKWTTAELVEEAKAAIKKLITQEE